MRVKDFYIKTDESKLFDYVSISATAQHNEMLIDLW